MPVTLTPVPYADLVVLASCNEPQSLVGRLAPSALPPSDVAQRILDQLGEGKSADWCRMFYITDQDSDKIVGTCGFKSEPYESIVEIGYGVSPTYRSMGVATSSVAQLLVAANALDPMVRVLAQINPENIPSARVVQKLAFVPGDSKIDKDGENLVQWLSRSEA